MKILHVIPGLTVERGGPSTVIEALTRCQASQGHQVTVLTTDQGARHGEHFLSLAKSVSVRKYAVVGPDRVAYAPRLKREAEAIVNASDIVHLHSIFTYPIHAALQAARRAAKPVVLRPCGLLHPYSLQRSRWVKNAYLTRWGRQIRQACSAWHYTSANESQQSWPNGNSRRFVLPNGIEPASFNLTSDAARAIVAETWPQLADVRYILFLGRLHPKKRLDLLIEAFLRGVPNEIKLVVAGPDECNLWPQLEQRLLGSNQAARRVVKLDAVRGTEKAALLTAAELFALPSEHENFGVAALEALACGTPILISPHVDLAGFEFDNRDVTTAALDHELWASELQRLSEVDRLSKYVTLSSLTDQPEPQHALDGERISEQHRLVLRSQIAENFAWDRVTKRLDDCYQWVLCGCTGEPPTFHPDHSN